MIEAKYWAIMAVMILLASWIQAKQKPQTIPVEQFKVHNFKDEIWHPHLSKSQLDNDNFVLVDNYKEHLRTKKHISRLQSNPNGNVGLKKVIDTNYYDNDMTPDTMLPGQNSTEKGPFNCAWKFTLSDTPKVDSNNYSTLINQEGSVDSGMLGEYVTLYDTKQDTKDSNSVTKSQTNQADPARSGNTKVSKNSTSTTNSQTAEKNNNSNNERIQVPNAPVSSMPQNPYPANLQYGSQMGANTMYQTGYVQQYQPIQQYQQVQQYAQVQQQYPQVQQQYQQGQWVQTVPNQVVYMNGQAYTLQPVGQQYVPVNYIQTPYQIPVGNGLNQVPTLIY